MENFEKWELERMVLAPYIQKSTALRGKTRYVGGNQFRHALGTMAILIDYHYIDPILLKAAIIHDLFEDVNHVRPDEIIQLDKDGPEVYKLVVEVTRNENETKSQFLERILTTGTEKAKVLKCADRISNLTDLHTDTFNRDFIKRYLEETKEWIIPMAEQVNANMLFELNDIIKRREAHLTFLSQIWSTKKVKH